MTIPPPCATHPLDNAPLTLRKAGRRTRLSGQIKSITNILILMLCHMAANANDGWQLAAPSGGHGVVQQAASLMGMYVAPQLSLPSTSYVALDVQYAP